MIVSRSKSDRRGVRGGHGAPAAVPGQQRLERQVGEVVDRPVGVAVHLVQHVELLAVRDSVGPDRARVAHVDHGRVLHVQPDPEGHEQHERRPPASASAARARAPPPRPRPEPGQQGAHQQVGEQRVHERHRDLDPPLVEVELGDAEAEQHQQVEVDEPQRPARVDEGQQEERRQRQPDPWLVEGAAHRGLAAAGQRGAACGPVQTSSTSPLTPLTTTSTRMSLPYCERSRGVK